MSFIAPNGSKVTPAADPWLAESVTGEVLVSQVGLGLDEVIVPSRLASFSDPALVKLIGHYTFSPVKAMGVTHSVLGGEISEDQSRCCLTPYFTPGEEFLSL